VSLFRLEWMGHLFEAGLSQASEPVPPQLISKGSGSVYAQLWAKIAGGEVRPVASQIAEILRAPPAPHALAVADAAAHPTKQEVAKDPPAKAEAATGDDAPVAASGEEEDWESDVVLRPRGKP